MNIAVLASTRGTDLQAIINEINKGKMKGVNLALVIANKKCGAAEKARKANVPCKIIRLSKKETRKGYDKKIALALTKKKIDLIVLVGWMRLFSLFFVKQFYGKIINIHPSLLPKYPGMDMDVHGEVIKNKEKVSGMTIHFVDEGMDTGPIIFQKKVKVEKDETPQSLKEKVQAAEKKYYPEIIRWFRDGKIKLKEGKVIIKK